MNILVTGANGQLGMSIRKSSENTNNTYFFSDVAGCDEMNTISINITDYDSVYDFVLNNKIDIIINCAAYTNVDAAESDNDRASLLNEVAPGYLAKVAKKCNALLIHISTDYVFGNCKSVIPYIESDYPDPSCVYGITKWVGECLIRKSGCKYIVIRTSWLYSEFGKNFCKTMLQLRVVFDQCGTPTYARDLADAIMVIVNDYDKNKEHYINSGIYHYSNEGVCSWFDFTKMIAEYAGNTECDIQPCHSNEYECAAKRPPYSVLDKSKIKNTFSIKIPYWIDSLKKCINNIKYENI